MPLIDYAQLMLLYKSLGITPFKVNYGYAPLTSYDWDHPIEPIIVHKKLNVEDAKDIATHIYTA